ncbi:MAG: hypothetical protein PHT84_07215, partial [Candidatus Pacebacteria bacterium]|nr:hypothetical protein [Candidatus Paceibacterota bacterium]
ESSNPVTDYSCQNNSVSSVGSLFFNNDGLLGKSLGFDGLNSYLKISNHSSLNPGSGLSLHSLVRSNISGKTQSIFSKGSYSLKIGPDNFPYFEMLSGLENINYVGRPGIESQINSTIVFDGSSYVAAATSGRVYRYQENNDWIDTGRLGTNTYIWSMVEYNGQLYAGTGTSGKVYRYEGDNNWVDIGRLGVATYVYSLAVYDGKLYAGTNDAGQVFRYDGDNNWVSLGQIATNTQIRSMVEFGGKLYVGAYGTGRVYRYDGGTTWTDVGRLGTGTYVYSLAVYNGKMYGSGGSNGRVYRYDGGTTWVDVGRLGTATYTYSLISYNGSLYGSTNNLGQVFRYNGGTSWTGLGQLGSASITYSLAVHDGKIFAGTNNEGKVFSIGSGSSVYSNFNLNNGRFNQLVGVYDGSSIKIYVNGLEKESKSVSGSFGGGTNDLLIGSSYGSSSGGGSLSSDEYFDGFLDEVAVWNKPLSSTEINNIYKRSVTSLKYQVRSCSLSDCSDSLFVGPGNSDSSFYSQEVNNNSANALFNLDVSKNKYFQYKIYLSTEDSSLSPIVSKVEMGGGLAEDYTESNCLNLGSYLVPEYLPSIPSDPKTGDDDMTGYAIKKLSTGRISVKSCGSELNNLIEASK